MGSERVPAVSIVAAALLLALDLFVFGQGFLPLFAAFAMIATQVPAAAWAAWRGDADRAWLRGGRAFAFAIAASLALAGARAQGTLAAGRAATIAKACQEFRQANGRFPDRLDELVPKHLPNVPRARWTALYGAFSYEASPDRHRIAWAALPPRGWRYIVAEDGSGGMFER